MSLPQLLWSAYERFLTLPTTLKDLSGRTIIITGANVGLGLEAARSIYAMNPARLILAVRSVSKGEDAKSDILSGGSKEAPPGQDRGETKLEVWELDLASFKSVKAFAGRCLHELDRLDVLLENAAIATGKWNTTADGWEVTIQTNVISTFMLATLLMPLLEKTANLPSLKQGSHLRPHLVILTSDIHTNAVFPQRTKLHILTAMNDKAQFVSMDRYTTSKLFDIFLTRELARHPLFQNGDVVLCSVNPGFCRSELMRDLPLVIRWIMHGLFARTTEEGAKTLLWASLEDKVIPGSYSSSCGFINPSKFVLSAEGNEIQKRLWKEVGEVVVQVAPETTSIWKS